MLNYTAMTSEVCATRRASRGLQHEHCDKSPNPESFFAVLEFPT